MVLAKSGFGVVVLGLCLVGAAFTTACGGGGSGDSGSSGGSGKLENVNTQDATPTPDTNRPEVVIEVHDGFFEPEVVTVKAGTKVVWKWVDTKNPHSIMLSGTKSPEQTTGTYERIFDQKGVTYPYQDGVSGAAMSGKIIVE